MFPQDFQRTLSSAVEEALSTLGESPKQAILFHLEKNFELKREEIPSKLAEFAGALEKLFGPGAPYMEKIILKRLYGMLNMEFEDSKLPDFLNSIEILKRDMLSEGIIEK